MITFITFGLKFDFKIKFQTFYMIIVLYFIWSDCYILFIKIFCLLKKLLFMITLINLNLFLPYTVATNPAWFGLLPLKIHFSAKRIKRLTLKVLSEFLILIVLLL